MEPPQNRISALKAWHTAHNVEWKGSTQLQYVLNGVHNLAPGTSRRPPRPPINATMLIKLVQVLDLNSPLDAAIAACATTAFWGQCRLGELLPPYPFLLPPYHLVQTSRDLLETLMRVSCICLVRRLISTAKMLSWLTNASLLTLFPF